MLSKCYNLVLHSSVVQLLVGLLAILPGIELLQNKQNQSINQMKLQVEFRVTPDAVKLGSRLNSFPGINTEPTKL